MTIYVNSRKIHKIHHPAKKYKGEKVLNFPAFILFIYVISFVLAIQILSLY